jgi:class 3 adenylate cyclase
VAVDVGGASADPVGVPGPGEPVEGRDGTVTILFADMVGFSGLTERMGDRDLQQLLADYHRIVRAALADHGGREVKVQGDGFMIAFAGVGRALRCATAVFEALARRRDGDGGPPIDAHMGLHTGEAIEEGEDYVGHTVVVASRLADAAGPGEVLVSQLSALLVARTGEFRFGPARELTLKGLAAPQPVMALQWRSGPADDGPAEPSEAQGP